MKMLLLLLVTWLSTVLASASVVEFQIPSSGLAPIDPTTSHRQLAAVSVLDRFRKIEKKGLRGFLEGGLYENSSPEDCAWRCFNDIQCLSFDFETLTQVCYVSHTDRYAHPEAFLDFPFGIYYEWQSAVDTPTFEPNGGLYTTQIAVRLFLKTTGADIHYRIVKIDPNGMALDDEKITAKDLLSPTGNHTVIQSGGVVILPPFSCRIYAVADKVGMADSPLVVSQDYLIYATKYAFLVPYFNGNEFHGRVVRIQLDMKGKKRPRPARFHEFSDYGSKMGIGPYPDQVAVIDMTAVHPDYKGFNGGFTAFVKTNYLNETFLVPTKDDPNYEEVTWRIVLEETYVPHSKRTADAPKRLVKDAECLFLAPFYNGKAYMGTVIRVLTPTFALPNPVIYTLNLTRLDPDLKGFASSFTDGRQYGYLVPQENENGLFGKLVRIDLNQFTLNSVKVLNLQAIDPQYVGFSSAIKYKDAAYLIPFKRPLRADEKTATLREFPVASSGILVRVNLTTFTQAGSVDLSQFHPHLVGFSGAVRVTHYAYLVPYQRVQDPSAQELNAYAGVVARVDLKNFKSVRYLDLTQKHEDLRGFVRGFAYRQYVFLVPHRSKFYQPGRNAQSSKLVRIDTTDFSLNGVQYLDLAKAPRSQVPDLVDDDLRGFSGGFTSGKYGFFVPFFNGAAFSGKICRINLEKFDEVQVLDLTQLDDRLRGFTDGIISQVYEPLETDLFAEFKVRPGTTTPYEYIY